MTALNSSNSGISRRTLFTRGATAAAAATLVSGGLGSTAQAAPRRAISVPFHGSHQAGITTPQQRQCVLAGFDVTTDRAGLKQLLDDWTVLGDALSKGEPAPQSDSGISEGMAAERFTMTVGFGPSLFDNRFGLASKRPAKLAPLPAFPGDAINHSISGGDIFVQLCADEPQVLSHALLQLRISAEGKANLRWTESGFVVPSTDKAASRNLLGVPDGTANPSGPDRDAVVWCDEGGWMAGGCYAVYRRIVLNMPAWMVTPPPEKEAVIGRRSDGSPLSAPAGAQLAEPNYGTLPGGAHVKEMHDFKMFRRGYNFDNGYEGGLLFMSFNKSPDQFINAQNRLSRSDKLGRYMVPTAAGLYACRGGVAAGGSLADGLL